MKVRIKYNLLNSPPNILELESNDIDVLCARLRELFNETGTMTMAETEDNIMWVQDESKTVLVSNRVKDENDSRLPTRETKK